MLWKVDGTKLHILGTAHLLDGPPKFRPYELKAIRQAVTVAFEADFRLDPPLRDGHYPEGQSLAGELGDEMFGQVVALGAQVGISVDDLQEMRPWLAQLRLSTKLGESIGLQPIYGVDRAVMQSAEAANRKLVFLEAVEDSISVFSDAPLSEQLAALKDVVGRPDQARADLLAIVESWHRRIPDGAAAAYEKWRRLTPQSCQAGVPDRNVSWMPQLLELSRERQPSLAAVGVLHLIGSGSLVELFREQGLGCSEVIA